MLVNSMADILVALLQFDVSTEAHGPTLHRRWIRKINWFCLSHKYCYSMNLFEQLHICFGDIQNRPPPYFNSTQVYLISTHTIRASVTLHQDALPTLLPAGKSPQVFTAAPNQWYGYLKPRTCKNFMLEKVPRKRTVALWLLRRSQHRMLITKTH